ILLAALVILFALRLDFTFVLTIFAIPFWNYPKILFGSFELSPVEVFTWAATAAFVLNEILEFQFARVRALFVSRFALLSALDFLALAFFLLGLASTRWAGNFGVASREFRIMVLDPILLYALLRMTNLTPLMRSDDVLSNDIRVGAHHPSPKGRGVKVITNPFVPRLVNALLASGVAVCVIGLYQFVTGEVILADGVARLTAVWGSPNNVGLYLGRLLPIALAFALLWRDRVGAAPRACPSQGDHKGGGDHKGAPLQIARWIYAALVALFGATILLTYSRGAVLLGVPASVLFVLGMIYFQAHHLSRRAWLGIGAALAVGVVALLWLFTTERFQSLFQSGTGTAFFRVAVWTSALQMIRDHPLLGVGL
ncbi:MAG: O-antigen ligase family protein, partial [Anaerolineales bacterium]|nr:O-antigen ligase family protein [Anaerolineales bacterium]